ncbi:MAG: right-handed parallel beta-helix repeat-containing protein [Candidatus Bipolaricaulota bacterium]|nr:MAG: right-handed parallel beta-helix repeat-containing protein [Candidatus Bipolaricaulota bacterium]
MRVVAAAVLLSLLVLGAVPAVGREIHLPEEAALAGMVIIADWFYQEVEEDVFIPREFEILQGVTRDADWASVQVLAAPGDVIVLAPGDYFADVWVFAPAVTVMTAPEAETRATIHGSLEIDADRVVLERIAVVDSDAHGIEINRELARFVTLRGCRSANNAWVGIHLIGPRGTIVEYRIEDCEVVGNGQDGIDVRNTTRLIITGCTITDNGKAGVFIESYVEHVDLEENLFANNAGGDVVYKNSP